MELTIDDLKVKRASVYVSNEESDVKDYIIGANFNTAGGKLERIDGGNVTKDGVTYASFYTGYGMEQSTTITYYNEANDVYEIQCEVNRIIKEFVELAIAKVYEEVSE